MASSSQFYYFPVFLRTSSRYSKKRLDDVFKYSSVLIDILENAATMRRSSPSDGEKNRAPSQINN